VIDGDAARAYGRARSYPVGTDTRYLLSGAGALVPQADAVQAGAEAFLAPGLGVPTSYSEISGLDPGFVPGDAAGTFAEYATAPLAANTDVVGIPTVRVHVDAPVDTPLLGPAGDLALFFKLYDIAPSGLVTLPDRLVSPVRIADPNRDVVVTLPGIVHRFAAGDRIALVIAGGDASYRGNLLPEPVTISTAAADPGVLTLPVASPGSYGPVVDARPDRAASARRRRRRHRV